MKWSAVYIAALSMTVGAGCTTTPEPVQEPGWETGAGSAAEAPPSATVQSSRAAEHAAHRVIATAVRSTNGDAAARRTTAPGNGEVVQTHSFDSPRFRDDAPGPDASAEEVAGWISAAREQGKSGAWLQRKLDAQKPGPMEESRLAWTAGDFDGDDRDDLGVVFFADCADTACERGGEWTVGVIWGAQGWSKLAATHDRRPEFLGPADLTGDERPELVVSLPRCGAHTCYNDLRVYGAHNERPFRQLLGLGEGGDGYGASGLPQQVELVRSEDEPARVVASGGMVASAGAGPFQRTSRTVWGWSHDEERMTRLSTQWEPSDMRLHRLHDAVVALTRGHTNEAVKRLWEVIEDDALDELPESLRPNDELARTLRGQLAEVARFLLARVALERGRTYALEEQRMVLAKSAPKSPATRATGRLQAEWRRSGHLLSACQVAATVFPSAPADEWLLDAHELGYNAPVKFDASRDNGLCAGL